jgi:arylsulfatase A-like enzyme
MAVFNAFSRHPSLKWNLVQYSEYPRVYTALTNIFLPNALSLHIFQSGEPQQHRPDHFYSHHPIALRKVKPAVIPDSLNLIVVVVDALRADVVTRDVPDAYIPEDLLQWAEQDAVSFSRAYSPSNSSFRSAAILFGTDANRHVLYPSSGLDNLLDVWLQEKRFSPLIVTNATGTIEMFGTGANVISLGKPYELDTKQNIPAEQLIDAFKSQLRQHRQSTPFFGYIHLMDVHNDLYRKPGIPLLADTPFDLYRHNVRYVSEVWGDFIDWMKSAGLYENTILVFTSDHGEEFKEHDSTLHGHHFFEEDLHVPLFMRIPGVQPAVFDKPVYTPDWLTTLLDLSGYEPEHPLYPDGFTQSLHMVFTGDSTALAAYDRPELYFQSNMTDKVGLLWQNRWKYEYWPTYQAHALFDLHNDPRERTNLIDDHPELARDLHARVVRHASLINGWTLKGGFRD